MSDTHPFIISLGSNLCYDQAESNLTKAETFLRELFASDIRFSSHYSTPGVGSGEGQTYINAVAIGHTSVSADEIRASLKLFELSLGRTPEAKLQGIVPIDLDLLSLGDIVFKAKDFAQQYVLYGLNQLRESSATR